VEKNKDGKPVDFFRKINSWGRTYYFEVRPTKPNGYFLVITEKRRVRKEDRSFNLRSKIFLYKNDFDEFMECLENAVSYIRTSKPAGDDARSEEVNGMSHPHSESRCLNYAGNDREYGEEISNEKEDVEPGYGDDGELPL